MVWRGRRNLGLTIPSMSRHRCLELIKIQGNWGRRVLRYNRKHLTSRLLNNRVARDYRTDSPWVLWILGEPLKSGIVSVSSFIHPSGSSTRHPVEVIHPETREPADKIRPQSGHLTSNISIRNPNDLSDLSNQADLGQS
jgi:hypothetical protein